MNSAQNKMFALATLVLSSSAFAAPETATTTTTTNAFPASEEGGVIREQSVTQTTVEDRTAYNLDRHALRTGLIGGISEVPLDNTDAVAGVALDFGLGKSPLSLGANLSFAGVNQDVPLEYRKWRESFLLGIGCTEVLVLISDWNQVCNDFRAA